MKAISNLISAVCFLSVSQFVAGQEVSQDTDGDGFTDKIELASGYNPKDSTDFGPKKIEKKEYQYPSVTKFSEFEMQFKDNVQTAWNRDKLGGHPENYFRIMVYNKDGRFIDAIRKDGSGSVYCVDGKIESKEGENFAVSKREHSLRVTIDGAEFRIELNGKEFHRGVVF